MSDWQDSFQEDAPATSWQASFQEEPSALDTAKQWGGLTYRNAVTGATALPEMIGNIPAATANAVRSAGDWALGIPQSSPSIPYTHPFSGGLDALGVPQPQTEGQRLYGDVTQPLFGVATGGAAAADLASNGGTLEKLLSTNMPLQYQAAAGGGAAGGLARERGAGPEAQVAASLLGSLAVPTAWGTLKGIGGAFQPFTDSGQNQIVANTLATYANDPTKAAKALENAPEYIKGAPQTAGTASGDYGLVKLEKTMTQNEPFTDTLVSQNKARLDALNQVAGTPKDIEAAQAARQAATKPLYDLASTQPINADAVKPVLAQIDTAVAQVGPDSDAGKTLLGMRAKITGALPQTKSTPTGLLDGSGNPIMTTQTTPKPLSNMSQIYRETRDVLQKKADDPGAYSATVRGVIQPINDSLGDALEQAHPLFGQAQAQFRQMSTPINQMETMQGIVKSVQNAGQQDAEGNFFLSPAKLGNLIKNGEVNTSYKGWQPLQDALSPNQYNTLVNVEKDVARSNLPNSPGVKAVGSNTFNNLASANALNRATGGAINANIPGTGGAQGWLYRNANDAIRTKLVQALQDPKLAAKLLLQGNPNTEEHLLSNTLGNIGRAAYAGQL